MAYYEELENIMNTAINMILENENICKLLYYYPEQVDYRYNPLSQPALSNPQQLLMKNVFPIPKTPDADLKQNCLLTVYMTGGEAMTTNKGFRRVNLVVDIICHLDCWMIKGGYRPIRIMSEIDKMFNYKSSNLRIVNLPESLPFRAREYSTKFYGYRISYELQVPSNVGC